MPIIFSSEGGEEEEEEAKSCYLALSHSFLYDWHIPEALFTDTSDHVPTERGHRQT